MFGHSDKAGNIGPTANSWNSAHLSNGCSLAELRETGSGGPVLLLRDKLIGGPMKSEVPLRLVLVDPPPDILFGVQRGQGARYQTELAQQRKRAGLCFDFSILVSDNRKDGAPNFLGDYVQGPASRRFVYIDVGTYAGQKDTPWSRRIIIRLDAITWPLIRKVQATAGYRLAASIPGRGKDGTPSCATVPIADGWRVVKD